MEYYFWTDCENLSRGIEEAYDYLNKRNITKDKIINISHIKKLYKKIKEGTETKYYYNYDIIIIYEK